jgi:hypothetical protein
MDKRVFLLVLSLISTATVYYSSLEQKDDYLEWKHQFGMVYSSEEDAFRRLIYLKNI